MKILGLACCDMTSHLFILNLRLECLAAQLVLTLSNFLMLIEEMRNQDADRAAVGRAQFPRHRCTSLPCLIINVDAASLEVVCHK